MPLDVKNYKSFDFKSKVFQVIYHDVVDDDNGDYYPYIIVVEVNSSASRSTSYFIFLTVGKARIMMGTLARLTQISKFTPDFCSSRSRSLSALTTVGGYPSVISPWLPLWTRLH